MNFSKYGLYVFIGLLIFCVGCGSNQTDPKIQNPKFSVDLPPGVQGQELFETIKRLEDKLKLDVLEKGYDSLQIRIWYAPAMSWDQELIVLKKNTRWDGEHFLCLSVLNAAEDKIVGTNLKRTTVEPKLSWPVFMKMLIQANILILPDSHTIKGYPRNMDAGQMTVEIATRSIYRLYSYPSPKDTRYLPEGAKVAEIMDILANNLNIPFGTLRR